MCGSRCASSDQRLQACAADICLVDILAVMPSKTTKAGDAAASKRVQPYLFFGKSLLNPYCKQGVPIFVPKGESEKSVLKLKAIAERRTSTNSELCHRMPYGVSMVAGTVEPAAAFLQKYAGDDKDFAKFGLGSFFDLLQEAKGEAFVEACKFLNVDNERDVTPEACKKHVKEFVTFLADNSGEKAEIFRRVALSSARMYLATTALLETTALIDHPKLWAKSVDRTGGSADLKNWLKDPEDLGKLQAAIVSALLARNKEKSGQKRKACALSDDDDDDDGAKATVAGGDTTSESEDKKKAKKQKAKKATKKGKKNKKGKDSSTSSSSTSSAKKTKKQKKGDKKDKQKSDDKATGGAALLQMLDADDVDSLFAEWAVGDIQKLSATVETSKAALPDLKTLKDILGAVPPKVLEHYDLAETAKKVNGMTKDPAKAAWKAILENIKTVVDAGEKAHSTAGASAKST